MTFAFAVALVLGTPGPTNTLLATGAATRGLRRCLPFMLAELSGYLISITTIMIFIRPFAQPLSATNIILRTLCGAYLLYLAATLWQARASNETGDQIGFRQIFLTTLLNPKGLLFALFIFPDASAPLWRQFQSFAIFTGICAVACTGWLTFGALIGRNAGPFVTPRALRRGGAVVLAFFAIVIVGTLAR
ncbi:MAG: LysE family transporter [Pseudorhodoplanes sp.]